MSSDIQINNTFGFGCDVSTNKMCGDTDWNRQQVVKVLLIGILVTF